METNPLNRISKSFKYILLAGAILYIVLYFILVFFRIQYPFELEWMEGGSVDHVRRILSGQKLYVSPSLEFVPFIYSPLYFYLSAVVSNIVGIGFMPLRLVSFISSLSCFFIIFLIVYQETGSSFSGILASSLFAATFRISGAWFDIARVDSLFLFFLLAALYLIKLRASSKSYVLAGVLISLSFLTKQMALVISLPMMFYFFLFNRRGLFSFIGTLVIILGVSTLCLNYIHDGWYTYYIFNLPRQHPIEKRLFGYFWINHLWSPLPLACIGSLFYIFTQLSKANKQNGLFYFLITIGMVGGSCFSRLHSGSYDNVLFPTYAIISILFGLATHTVFEFFQASNTKRKLIEFYIYLFCIIQFVSLIYNPLHQIPSKKDLDAGRKLINKMAQIKGDIFVPYHGYLAALAGKNNHAQGMAMVDVLRGNDSQAKTKLNNEIRQALREKRFGAIILDSHWLLKNIEEYIEEYYVRQGPVFDSDTAFWPVTGMQTRPELIYLPKSNDK